MCPLLHAACWGVVNTNISNISNYVQVTYSKKDINLNVHFHQTFIVQPSHVVTLTHSTIQYGVTALQQASNEGRQKVVELLLVAGANPDLQNKVRTGWHSA